VPEWVGETGLVSVGLLGSYSAAASEINIVQASRAVSLYAAYEI
jgi:hypothetical protein